MDVQLISTLAQLQRLEVLIVLVHIILDSLKVMLRTFQRFRCVFSSYMYTTGVFVFQLSFVCVFAVQLSLHCALEKDFLDN